MVAGQRNAGVSAPAEGVRVSVIESGWQVRWVVIFEAAAVSCSSGYYEQGEVTDGDFEG